MQQARGVAAEQAWRVVGEAFEKVKKQYVDAWQGTNPRDNAGREKLWVATTVVSAVERHIRQCVEDGKVAEKQLVLLRKAGEPKRSVFGVSLP